MFGLKRRRIPEDILEAPQKKLDLLDLIARRHCVDGLQCLVEGHKWEPVAVMKDPTPTAIDPYVIGKPWYITRWCSRCAYNERIPVDHLPLLTLQVDPGALPAVIKQDQAGK